MTTRLKVILHLQSDFHVGTGTGRGRVLDAVVVRDRSGRPIVPGSTIKGLALDQARRLIAIPGASWPDDVVDRVFGVRGQSQGAALFGRATPAARWLEPAAFGRSARSRETGRARDDALFREELAPAMDFEVEVEAPGGLDLDETLLLVAALRRVEAVGRARSRGRGAVSVDVEILDGPFRGARVPGAPGSLMGELAIRLGVAGPNRPEEDGTRVAMAETHTRTRALSAAAKAVAGPLVVVARALDPLVLPASPEAGNVTRSLGHLPGTTLRGAVAAAALRQGWEAGSDAFQRAFVRDDACFGPLYPAVDPWGVPRSLPLPAPLSLASCKRHSGIVGDPASSGAHGGADLLRAADPPDCCGSCDGPIDPLGGIVQAEHDSVRAGAILRQVEQVRHVAMHVAIDENSGRAAEHELFAHEEVPEDTVLVGLLWGSPDLLGALQQLLDGRVLSVGKARTRGVGRVKLAVAEPDVPLLGGHPAIDDGFTLTLYSDLVAVDPLLRSVTRMESAALWRTLGGRGTPPFDLVRGYARTRHVASFNGLPGRPRSVDLALVAGSCWRYRWTDPTRVPDVRSLLADAERAGIGLRRGEGFGRVIIDLPLHHMGLDQARGRDTPVGLATWTPAVPGPRSVPSNKRPTTFPRRHDLSGVRPEERDGLARLLLRAACADGPGEVLSRALNDRAGLGKGETEVDHVLRRFGDQAADGSEASRLRLRSAAAELVGGGGR